MLKKIAERFKEPSSWAGMAALFAALGWSELFPVVSVVGAAICTVLAVVIPEGY